MSKRLFILVIILMSVSLTGIVLVQLFWIRNAIKVKNQQFDLTINSVLINVVDRLKTDENVSYVTNKLMYSENGNEVGIITTTDSLLVAGTMDIHSDSKKQIILEKDNLKTIKIKTGKDDAIISIGTDEEIDIKTIVKLDSLKSKLNEDHYILLTEMQDSINLLVETKLTGINSKAEDITSVIDQMVWELQDFNTPIEKSLTYKQVNERIKEALDDKNIELPYEFAVYNPDSDSVIQIKSPGFNGGFNSNTYTTRFFPETIFEKPEQLILNFPGKREYLLRSLSILLTGSILFTIIILLTFSITIYIILRQKKLSDIKSDFINNMTHEFKTPIATISLAVDSINNHKTLKDEEKVKYFTGIISEETKRMNTQVENVLQMSLIDKKDFDFRNENLNIHETIEQVIQSLELQLRKTNGIIKTELLAQNPVLKTDKSHLQNIITNLLDNAFKYSDDDPIIIIKTINNEKGIFITVEDKGIGMTKGEREKIFDKFYRVSQGDIHNVKGFGLGLSYVKAVVLAMDGEIKVKSEKGQGTTFQIFLPF